MEPVRCASPSGVAREELDRFAAVVCEAGGDDGDFIDRLRSHLSPAARSRTLLVVVRPVWTRIQDAVLSLGIRDFVRMPVSADELTIRVLMCVGPPKANDPLDHIRDQLTERERALLHELMLAGGAVVSKRDLLDRVWRSDRRTTKSAGLINVHVRTLRQKLERLAPELCLVTERGRGYALVTRSK